MGIESLIIFLFIGAVAGWLASLLVGGVGFGLLGDIIVGIIGAFVAGLVLPAVGIAFGGGIIASILNATIGAVIFLLVVKVLKRA